MVSALGVKEEWRKREKVCVCVCVCVCVYVCMRVREKDTEGVCECVKDRHTQCELHSGYEEIIARKKSSRSVDEGRSQR